MRRLAILLLALLPALAAAEGRKMLAAHQQYDWRSVGRLNFGDAFCTGALVLPDVVVTAAHCLYAKRTGAVRLPERTHFVAGYRLRKYEGHQRASDFTIHPRFALQDRAEASSVATDLALVRLEAPLSELKPFHVAAGLEKGDEVTIVSYGRDRPEIPSIQSPCAVEARFEAIAVLDCDVTYGVSGAPVFRRLEGEWRIVAAVSSMGTYKGRQHAFAVVLEDALGILLAPPLESLN